MKRLPARASTTLRAVIDSAGPVSAATRALLWLGADASGLPISPAGQREIAALLVENLEPCVLTALHRLYDRLRDSGCTHDTLRAATRAALTPQLTRVSADSRAAHAAQAPIPERDDTADPFANVGIEFAG
jgi:hypothetical protein